MSVKISSSLILGEKEEKKLMKNYKKGNLQDDKLKMHAWRRMKPKGNAKGEEEAVQEKAQYRKRTHVLMQLCDLWKANVRVKGLVPIRP